MKALTLQQPWASLLMLGAKKYETRSWPTRHRGTLIIHAGRTFPEASRKLASTEPFQRALGKGGIQWLADLPLGVILGTVTVRACVAASKVATKNLSDAELTFGDFGAGRWAWEIASPQPLPAPIAYQGNRGIFDVPDEFCRQAGLPVVERSDGALFIKG